MLCKQSIPPQGELISFQLETRSFQLKRGNDGGVAQPAEVARNGTFPTDHLGSLQLPLQMHPVPAMLQWALDRGDMTPGHVTFQSMERLLYQAYGMDRRCQPAIGTTCAGSAWLAPLFGSACVHFMHGPGRLAGHCAHEDH